MTMPGRLWLSGRVVDLITSEADQAVPNETGGVLLGYSVYDTNHVVVTNSVDAGPDAEREKNRFIPDYDYQDSEIARIYQQSHRQISYLGDWHSHPGGDAKLSRADRRTFRNIAAYPDARVPKPTMLILTKGPDWIPVAWMGRFRPRLLWLPRFITTPVDISVFDPE